jgi:hypothetical protein
VVEEYGATTVVFPGQRVEVDRFGNMILARTPGGGDGAGRRA